MVSEVVEAAANSPVKAEQVKSLLQMDIQREVGREAP